MKLKRCPVCERCYFLIYEDGSAHCRACGFYYESYSPLSMEEQAEDTKYRERKGAEVK